MSFFSHFTLLDNMWMKLSIWKGIWFCYNCNLSNSNVVCVIKTHVMVSFEWICQWLNKCWSIRICKALSIYYVVFFYYFYNTLYNRYILKIKAHLLYSNAIYTTYFHRCFHVIFKHKIQTIENYMLYFDFVIIWFFFSNERLLLMIFIDSLIIYASVWFKWIRIEYEEIFWI